MNNGGGQGRIRSIRLANRQAPTVDVHAKRRAAVGARRGPGQDAPPTYVLNGAVYVAQTEWLRTHETFVTLDTVVYPMPRERAMDVDKTLDLRWCETIKVQEIT